MTLQMGPDKAMNSNSFNVYAVVMINSLRACREILLVVCVGDGSNIEAEGDKGQTDVDPKIRTRWFFTGAVTVTGWCQLRVASSFLL